MRHVRQLFVVTSLALGMLAAAGAPVAAQTEHQIKAAYLYNFVKYVEWPPHTTAAPFSICLAGRTPLAAPLAEIVRGELFEGRTLVTRILTEPEADCDVLFVPQGVDAEPYLRAVASRPTLTVGESPAFLTQGGMIAFALEGAKVRFDVNADAPARVDLRISSRVLRLARNTEARGRQ